MNVMFYSVLHCMRCQRSDRPDKLAVPLFYINNGTICSVRCMLHACTVIIAILCCAHSYDIVLYMLLEYQTQIIARLVLPVRPIFYQFNTHMLVLVANVILSFTGIDIDNPEYILVRSCDANSNQCELRSVRLFRRISPQPNDFICFQCTAQHSNHSNAIVLRLYTQRSRTLTPSRILLEFSANIALPAHML